MRRVEGWRRCFQRLQLGHIVACLGRHRQALVVGGQAFRLVFLMARAKSAFTPVVGGEGQNQSPCVS